MAAFDLVYTHIKTLPSNSRIALVKYMESGYYTTSISTAGMTDAEVDSHVAWLNSRLDVPADVVMSMQYASCFGWDVPIAERAHQYMAPHEGGR